MQCHLYLSSSELYLPSKASCWHVHLTLLCKYVTVKAHHTGRAECVLLSVSSWTALQHLCALTLFLLSLDVSLWHCISACIYFKGLPKPSYHCQKEVYPTLNQPITPASLLPLVNVHSFLAFFSVPFGSQKNPIPDIIKLFWLRKHHNELCGWWAVTFPFCVFVLCCLSVLCCPLQPDAPFIIALYL